MKDKNEHEKKNTTTNKINPDVRAVIYLSNFLRNALARAGCSELLFTDSPRAFGVSSSFRVLLGYVTCPFKKRGRRGSACGSRDGVCLELSLPASAVAWLPVTCERVPREPLPSWTGAVRLEERARAALSGSKNSWLGEEIVGKLSFPRDLSVTVFNSPAKS